MSQTPAYDALEWKHQRFVDRLLTAPSATAAYADVYQVEPETAAANASRLLGNAKVQEALAERRAVVAARTAVTAQRIVEEYAAIAFSNMRTFVTWGPEGVTLVGDEMLTDADARCVSEVSQTKSEKGGSLRIKLHDKKGALDKLAEFWAIDHEMIRRLFPDLAPEELEEGVVSILKRIKGRRDAVVGGAK